MINKIKGLFNKIRKQNHEDTDLKDSDFTSDIPDFSTLPSTPEEDEDLLILDEQEKLSFKERAYDLKTKASDFFSRFRKKKSAPMLEEQTTKKKLSIKSPIKPGQFNIANLHKDLLLSVNRTKIHKVFQLSFIFLILFTLGKSTALFLQGSRDFKNLAITPLAEVDFSRELKTKTVNQIKFANLFKTNDSVQTQDKPKKKEEVKTNLACTKADRKSNLPIKLINTIVLQDSVKSIASVQVRSERLFREIRVGEEINNLAKIDKIERLRLVVKNLKTGSCEAIESAKKDDSASPIAVMSPKASKKFKKLKPISGIKNFGNRFEIDKSFMREKMKNISQIITEARGIQINNPDGSLSFKIVDVVPGSVYSYLNINDGDTITGIGGEKITDLNAVMSLFSKLHKLDQTSITIKRGGKEVTQEYKFK